MTKADRTKAEKYYAMHQADDRLTASFQQSILFHSLLALASSPVYRELSAVERELYLRWYKLHLEALGLLEV